MDFLTANWPLVAIVAALAVILLWFVLRPGQRVELSQPTPLRPHMTAPAARAAHGEGKGLIDEAAAAAADITGPIIDAKVHAALPGASGPPDQLVRLKGVGPKLAGLLNQAGLMRFDQIAKLSPEQLRQLDASLGSFRGRLVRDQIVAQADYLARGDIDGFEHRFGKL